MQSGEKLASAVVSEVEPEFTAAGNVLGTVGISSQGEVQMREGDLLAMRTDGTGAPRASPTFEAHAPAALT